MDACAVQLCSLVSAAQHHFSERGQMQRPRPSHKKTQRTHLERIHNVQGSIHRSHGRAAVEGAALRRHALLLQRLAQVLPQCAGLLHTQWRQRRVVRPPPNAVVHLWPINAPGDPTWPEPLPSLDEAGAGAHCGCCAACSQAQLVLLSLLTVKFMSHWPWRTSQIFSMVAG